MIGFLHTAFGFCSLLTGLLVFINPKGTRPHRQIGNAYFLSMLLLNITAFGIYDLFGGFGIFHWAALLSLTTIILAVLAVRFRRRFENWLSMHYQFMCWSYLGLLGATSNEFYVHIPLASKFADQYLWLPWVSLLVIFGLGGAIINRREAVTLERLKKSRSQTIRRVIPPYQKLQETSPKSWQTRS